MKKRQIIILSAVVGPLLVLALCGAAYTVLYAPVSSIETKGYLFVDGDDNADSVRTKVNAGWRYNLLEQRLRYTPRTGRYAIEPGEPLLHFMRKIRNGMQEPLPLTLPSVRTMDRLAGLLGHTLMMDSAQIIHHLTDSSYLASHGHTETSLPSLFLPNTYQIYWNVSMEGFMKRMKREYDAFWTPQQQQLAASLGLTPLQVSTLASIVDEETANDAEKPLIAALYMNRLRKGMLLQADPTVKFALGDFGLRRILYKHLKTESPYNTYLHKGLPPGPIRIPTMAALQAVLHPAQHPYLYMCAKEDFSGTHNFAKTLAEHMRNARRYQQALNKRKIN